MIPIIGNSITCKCRLWSNLRGPYTYHSSTILYDFIPLRNIIACRAFGGEFRKWLAIVTRTLWKGRICIEDCYCMWESLENDLQSWQELYERGGCQWRNAIACRALGGGSFENDLQSWQELYERERFALRTTIACSALGGKFRKWLAIVTRTLWKRRLRIEEYHCM